MNSDRLLSETRITFKQLAKEQNVSLPTVWRWSGPRGVKGHVLESFSVGIKKFSTREAFSRWIAKINGEPVRRTTDRQRQRLHEADDAQLVAELQPTKPARRARPRKVLAQAGRDAV